MTKVLDKYSGKYSTSKQIQIQQIIQESIDDENKFAPSMRSSQEQDKNYFPRPDLYGLMAIATIEIIINQAFPEFMPGGFFGADIILVISGYLSSTMIIQKIQKNCFSPIHFYRQRLMQITPVLIIVMIFVLLSALISYKASQIIMTTKTMVASTIFCTNFQLLTYEQGYFDPILNLNPLRHLWLLGIEQQFTAMLPWLLICLLSTKRISGIIILSVLTFCSFIFGMVMAYEKTKFSILFPLCRFWQMLIGVLIAYRMISITQKIIRDIISVIGIVLIIGIVWIVDQTSLIPGWWGLIISLGSVCVLLAGTDSLINKHILSSKFLVYIGKISFSLYLWYWPLKVISTISIQEKSDSIFAKPYSHLFICGVLSVLTYHFVEKKLRHNKKKIIAYILILLLVALGITSLFILKTSQKIKTNQIGQMDQIIEVQINGNDTVLIEYLRQYQKSLIPGKQDYYIKNGKKLPNSSKNPKRDLTSVEKLQACLKFNQWDYSVRKPHLEKNIDQKSKYFEKDRPQMTVFEVANEGRQKELFLVGDSHTKFLGWRIQYLFEKAKKFNQLESFPTVVEAIKQNTPLNHYNKDWVDFADQLIMKHKPDRLLMANRWFGYWKWCYRCPSGMKAYSDEHFEMIKLDIQYYTNVIGQFVKAGIEVFIATIHLDDERMNPQHMYNESGVIESNIGPIRLSQFRQANYRLIQMFQSNLQKSGAKLIHLSDSHCWNDTCHLLSPTGYSLFIDDNHHGKLYSRYWASSIDFLVDF